MWVPHDTRDAVVDFVNYWSERSGIYASQFIRWLGIVPSKFYDWKKRYGKVNEHNSWIPRDFWLGDWEKQAIVNFFFSHPGSGGHLGEEYILCHADHRRDPMDRCGPTRARRVFETKTDRLRHRSQGTGRT